MIVGLCPGASVLSSVQEGTVYWLACGRFSHSAAGLLGSGTAAAVLTWINVCALHLRNRSRTWSGAQFVLERSSVLVFLPGERHTCDLGGGCICV